MELSHLLDTCFDKVGLSRAYQGVYQKHTN